VYVLVVEAMRVAVGSDVLADLPWDFVWDLLTVFLWDAVAFLAWNLDWDLSSDLGALLSGHVGAGGLDDVPDCGHALGLGNRGAPWSLDDALGLNWNLLADAFNLALAYWSMANGIRSGDVTVEGLGVSLGLCLGLSVSLTLVQVGNTWSDGGNESAGDRAGSNSWGGDSMGGDSMGCDSWGGDSDGSWLVSNVLNIHLALNSDQLSFLADLGLNVLALLDEGGVDNGVGLVDASLLVPGGALFVGHLASDGVAPLLGHGGAGSVELGSELSLGDGLASLLVSSGALGRVAGLVDSLADWVRPVLVAVRLGVAAVTAVWLAVTSVVAVCAPVATVVAAVVTAGLCVSLGFRFAHHQ